MSEHNQANNDGVEKLILEYKEIAQREVEKNLQNINKIELDICSQLMLLDTVLLTGIFAVVSIADLITILNIFEKRILFGSLTLLFLAIVSGIFYYFVIQRFFENWAKTEREIRDSFKKEDKNNISKINNTIDKANKLRQDMNEKTSSLLLILQISFSFFSFILLLLVIYRVLF